MTNVTPNVMLNHAVQNVTGFTSGGPVLRIC
jgi:hypothetical protein